MLPSLLLVAALLSSVRGVPHEDVSTTELGTLSLDYVYTFFRHGIRSPLYKTYPTDPNADIYYKLFKGQLGELTKKGKQEMYKVGKQLYQIYGKFVGDFSEGKVRASSTETSRTIMSALSVMAGLFPPKKPLMKGLNWQPIPIWQDTRDFDKAYFYNGPDFPNLALKQCPRYGKMIKQGYDIVKAEDKTPSRRKLYQQLQQETKLQINSIDSAYMINDILEFEKRNGLELPKWATEGDKPIFPDQLRPLHVDWFLKCQWLNKDPTMLSFYAGPLFDSINDKFTDKITQKNNKERFRYHNTHDDTLFTLRWALGFDSPDVDVEPGDGMAFELHKLKVREEYKYFVQVVYYHSLREGDSFREVLQLSTCPTPCPLEKFTKLYPGVKPQDWEKMCKE